MRAFRLLLQIFILSLFTVHPQGQFISEGLIADREALLSLRNAVTDFGNSKIASWRPTGNPCFPKAWRHITCAAGRVMHINLSNRQVAGFLPGKLRLASKLVTLDLDGNRFTGGIPNNWAARSSFASLRTLNLAHNELTGTLPNWNRAGAWRRLDTVDLSSNNFYGGLPANWLGLQRAIRNVVYLDLSNNYLGRANGSVSGNVLSKDVWCENEAGAKLYSGSGWCPGSTPIGGTASSLVTLDLANNALTGPIPERWPTIFRNLVYLRLQFNSLSKQDGTTRLATILPREWTSDRKKGFPSLSLLTLYPGNEYLCSIPAIDGGFLDVNKDATYQVVDTGEWVYDNENPRLCPTDFMDDNPVDTVTLAGDKTTLTWTYDDATMNPSNNLWGFRISMWMHESEGDYWMPLTNWNAVYLRTYIRSDDGFSAQDVSDQGLDVSTSGTVVLTFADISAALQADRLPLPSFAGYFIDEYKAEVSVVNLDNIESSSVMSPAV